MSNSEVASNIVLRMVTRWANHRYIRGSVVRELQSHASTDLDRSIFKRIEDDLLRAEEYDLEAIYNATQEYLQ